MPLIGRLLGFVLLVGTTTVGSDGAAEEPSANRFPGEGIAMQTLGGRQFWGDVRFFHDWRIQQNVFTSHYRLLDGENRRHASGTYEQCIARLNEIREERQFKPMSGKGVILVHGIIRSSRSFEQFREALGAAGFTVFGFDYPSTRLPISESALMLQKVIESLEGIEEIHLVVHSMGGLVVRSYLAQADEVDPRIKRMVMMGVPNRGAGMADRVRDLSLFKMIFGPAGQQLVTDEEGLISSLPTPQFEFGILSGARGTENGYNPLIPGDDDGTVELANTRLPGASDFITVNTLHSFLMRSPEAVAYTVRYLKTGAFRESGCREPIPVAP